MKWKIDELKKINMSKKIFSLLLINFIVAGSFAQLNTNLILSTTPTAVLTEWANRKDVLTYIISSSAGQAVPVKIKTELKTSDGTVIGFTDLAKARIFTVGGANIILNAIDVMPLEITVFTGKYQIALQKTGKLPADNYQLCVQLVTPTDYRPLSEIKCKFFYVASLQLPILMKPYNEEVLDAKIAQTAITFRWTPVVPRLTAPVTYRIQVFEVLQYQTPVQALRSNQPLLDREVRGTTQYIWRPQISMMEEIQDDAVTDSTVAKKQAAGKKFIWTIQSLDAAGLPAVQTDGNGEARSEPVIFYTGHSKNK